MLLVLLLISISGASPGDLALLRMRFVVWSQSPAVDLYFDWCSVTLGWPTGVSESKSPDGAEICRDLCTYPRVKRVCLPS